LIREGEGFRRGAAPLLDFPSVSLLLFRLLGIIWLWDITMNYDIRLHDYFLPFDNLKFLY